MNKTKSTIISTAVFVAVALVISVLPYNNSREGVTRGANIVSAQTVTMYKSPNCGCCAGYAKALEEEGFNVEVIPTEDMNAIKESYDVPMDMQSCHTIEYGEYFIEGHVPMEAVEKLMKEQPAIDGIGLPRMPAGALGMPGVKRAPFEVYQSTRGEYSEFITI